MSTTSSSDPVAPAVICSLCGEPVPYGIRPFQRVRGWERKPLAASRRGGSDIVARERLNEWACDQCVRLVAQGFHLGRQDQLFPL